MKVTRILATSLLAAVAMFAATNAHAQVGALSLSWASCSYVQNLDFTGPGQVANLVCSIQGESRDHRGNRVQVAIGSNLQDAWRFDAAGCNVGQASLVTSALNKTCAAYQGTNPLPIFNYGYDGITGKALLDVLNAYDMATGSGATQTVWQLRFDHAFSETGPQDPIDFCGGAEHPVCFHIVYTEHLNPDLSSDTYNVANDFVTWQDAGNSTGCPGATQTENSTWGRVKGLYR